MNGMTAALLVVLGLAGPARAPDLQVEATSASGAGLPELTDAVARALVAGGARVVLKPPASEPCAYCARVVVVESGPGVCRVEVSQERHRAAATLRLPAGSPLLDRARAIAIQARLLVTWETSAAAKPREVAARPPARKLDRSASAERSLLAPESARTEVAAPVAAPAREPMPSPVLPSERPLAREPLAGARPPGVGPVAPPKPPPRAEVKSVTRAEAKLPAEDRPAVEIAREAPAEPERRTPAKRVRPESDAARAADLTASVPAVRKPLWPWIPTAIGAGGAVAAGACALLARDRYNGLSDRTQPYTRAQALKSEGESWQLASFVLAGVAVAGVGTGVVGFATRSPVVTAAPVPGGGVVALTGGLP